MTTYPVLENEVLPSVGRTACLLSLRKTLKQHAAVYGGEPFTLALIVPEEIQSVYARAFDRLRREEPEVADVELGTSSAGVKRVADYKHIKAMLRLSERVLILLDKEEGLPSYLTAAADLVTKAARIDSPILMEAVRATYAWELSEDEADVLLKYPIEDVFAALRRGRSASEVRGRLEAARATTLDVGAVKIEQLSGYAEAADWAKAVISDVSDWKAGRLSWRDVDAGALISGPPGVGKTLFREVAGPKLRVLVRGIVARAVAGGRTSR